MKKTRASWDLLPMFVDERHRTLGRKLEGAIDLENAALHDPVLVIPTLAKLGVLDLLVPEKHGGGAWGHQGTSLDVRALCIAREAIAYASPVADSIFAVQGLGSYPLVRAGGHAKILAEVVNGTRVCAFALTEPEAGSDVASMRAVARKDGDGWRLEGEKVYISNVGIANHYVVFANAAPELGKKGISAFLLDARAEGLDEEPIAMSVDHPLGRLTFRDAKASLIGEVGQGLGHALGTLDVFRTSVGAAAVGMARRALDEAMLRVTTRRQFGKTLAEQQLTQAAIADMATELDAARLLVLRAAWEKDNVTDPREGAVSVAMAKMFATEAAQRIIDRAVQLFGGLGVTDRCVVDQLYREIRPLRIYEGTTEIQKLIIGGALLANF